MAKQIKQFRYYEQNSNKNYPNTISLSNLASGSIFSKYVPIIQLGIQSLPGTKFYLNNSNDPVIIGNTGIYELNLNGLSEITAIAQLRDNFQSLDELCKSLGEDEGAIRGTLENAGFVYDEGLNRFVGKQ